jgi:hypothetical protein
MAVPPYKNNERHTNEQRQAKQDDVNGDRVVLEGLVRSGVEGRLREVEDTGETDDKAVDFAEGGEAEDFGGVVADSDVSK